MTSLSYDDIFLRDSDCGEPACSFMENLELLRKSPFFSGASLETLKLFAYFFRKKSYAEDQLILKQGERADSAFFLVEGEVEACYDIDGDKKESFVLQKMGPLTFFGELALLARFECFHNVVARTDVTLLSLDRESFQKVLSKFPDKQNDFVEQIVQLRIKRFESQMGDFIRNLRASHD